MSAEQDTDGPTVIDAEQVDPGDRPLIDPPPDRERLYRTLLMSSTMAQRRPIVPAWLRDRGDARSLGRFVIRHGLHVSTYHLTRSPKYAARLARRTPVGLVRLVMVSLRFWWDAEAAPLRREAVDRKAFEEYFKLTRERNARVRTCRAHQTAPSADAGDRCRGRPRVVWRFDRVPGGRATPRPAPRHPLGRRAPVAETSWFSRSATVALTRSSA